MLTLPGFFIAVSKPPLPGGRILIVCVTQNRPFLNHAAALESFNAENAADIEIRKIKYLNNIVEQDHRAVKRVVRPMLGFKSFRSAAATIAGIELMHMIRKGQLRATGKLRPAQQFYALAG